MAKIADFPVLSFRGGVRRDKSAYELRKDELLNVRNLHVDDDGKLVTRRGSHEVGDSLSDTVENVFPFIRYSTTGTAVSWVIANTNQTTSVISNLVSTRLTGNITTASTTISVVSTTNTPTDFAASGTMEIDGDIITYTGNTGTTFTGCSGIRVSHLAGASVNQWKTLAQSGTAVDGRLGIYYAVINNILIINGRGGNSKQFDGSNITDLSNEPAILFATNYRDRLYGAGDGSNGTNGSSRRVSFSARGDGTSWTTGSDFFDVQDQGGEAVTGFRVNTDRLGIFKTNRTFLYDEIELKESLSSVGAYNHKIPVEINGLIYTFCPDGIFETNLVSARPIGEPVREIWERFRPIYDSVSKRVCTNTFAWREKNSYFLFLGSYSFFSSERVVLEYNTKTQSWTIHSGGYENFYNTTLLKDFRYGDNPLNFSGSVFGSNTSGHVYKMSENRYLDGQSTPVLQGGDLYKDLVNDNDGDPISAYAETGLLDLTHPELFKTFRYLRILIEEGVWNVSYRVENERGIISKYKSLGSSISTTKALPFPSEAQGFRIGLKFSCTNPTGRGIFNGYIFEDTEVSPRP